MEGRLQSSVFAEGMAEEKNNIARNLLALGLSDAVIIEATGLTPDQLKNLRNSFN